MSLKRATKSVKVVRRFDEEQLDSSTIVQVVAKLLALIFCGGCD
jgi:hypothetical protein